MKTLVVAMVVALFSFGCSAQDQYEKGSEKSTLKNDEDSPKESWTVKKEVDENGNVIGYDSIYTWSYSTMNGDSVTMNVDSVMQSVQSFFDQTMPSVWDHNLMNPMLNDSLLGRDLFSDNYFQERWNDDFFDMEKMFQQMDSIRNQFFNQQFPDIRKIPAPPETGKQDRL